MKKKLLKTFMLAVGLLVGGNAWATDVPYNVGTSTDATYLSATSDVWEMTGDGVLTVTFTNHCKTDANNWLNWHLICGNATDKPSDGDVNTNRYFVMRADRWENVAGSSNNFWVSDNYFTDFMTWSNGATVNLKVVRYGKTVNVYTTATKDATTYTMGYVKTNIPKDETIKFYLTGSESYMEITAQNVSTTVAGEEMTNAYMSFTADNGELSSKTFAGELGTMTWANHWTAKPYIDNNMFRFGNMNDGIVPLVGEAAGSKDIVTISFDLGLVALTGKSVEFKVTDVNSTVLIDEAFVVYNGGTPNRGFLDGQNTLGFDINDFVDKSGTNNPGLTNDTKNSFTLTFNYATGKIFGSVTNKNGTVNKQIDMPVGAGAIASFAVRGNYNNAARCCYFDNLKITTEIGDYAAVATTYTVKYKSGGVEIKDEATGRVGDVGATPVLDASDTETFYSVDGEHKYVYDSDNASTTTIAAGGTTVVTVNFTDYEKRDYTLNAVDKANNATVLGEIATGYVYADAASTTVNTPWYVLYNGTLYNRNGNSTSFDVDDDDQVSKIEYEATEITNVVSYSEGEKLSGVTTVFNSIASNRGIARIPNETTFANLGAGSYTVYMRAHAGNSSGGTAIFKAGDTEFARKAFAGSTNNQDFNASFALTGTTDVKIKYDTGNATGLDYIYVVKNGDEPIVSKTISAAGWATYYSPYALDFSGSITNLTKAYIITGNSGAKLTLEQITGTIPANTGILLEGEGAVSIPVVASSSTDVSANILKGVTAPTVKDAESIYVLMNETPGVGFYKNNNEFTVGANTAYIDATDLASARAFYLFDDMTTGVNDVRSKTTDNIGEVYNLNGQRVAQPTKGLYIVNGKKVVIK